MGESDFDTGGGHVMELSPRNGPTGPSLLGDQASASLGTVGGSTRARSGTSPIQRSAVGTSHAGPPAGALWQYGERRPLQRKRDLAGTPAPIQRATTTKKQGPVPTKSDPDDAYPDEVKAALKVNRKQLSNASALEVVQNVAAFNLFLGLPEEALADALRELQSVPAADPALQGAKNTPPPAPKPDIAFARLLKHVSPYLSDTGTYAWSKSLGAAIAEVKSTGQPKWVHESLAFYRGDPKNGKAGAGANAGKPSSALIRDLRRNASKDPAARALADRLLSSRPNEVTADLVWLIHLAQKAQGQASEDLRTDFKQLDTLNKQAPGARGRLHSFKDSLQGSQEDSRLEQLVSEYDTSKGKLSRDKVRELLRIKYEPGGKVISEEFKKIIKEAADKEGKKRDGYIRHPLVSATLDPTGAEYKQMVPEWGKELATIHGSAGPTKVKMNVTMECRPEAEPTGGLAYQCAELATRFAKQQWGLSIGGNGGSYATPGAISAIEVFQAGETKEAPRSFDFVAYRSGSWGHVGILSSVVQTGDTITAKVHQQNVRSLPKELKQAEADADLSTSFTRVNGRWTGGNFGYQAFDAWSRPKGEVERARAAERDAPFPLPEAPVLTDIAQLLEAPAARTPDPALVLLFKRLHQQDVAVVRKAWYAYSTHLGKDNAFSAALGKALHACQLNRSQVEQILMEFREAGIEAPEPSPPDKQQVAEGSDTEKTGSTSADPHAAGGAPAKTAPPGAPRLRSITPLSGNAYPAFAHYHIRSTPVPPEVSDAEGSSQSEPKSPADPAGSGTREDPAKASESSKSAGPGRPGASSSAQNGPASKDKKNKPDVARLEAGASAEYALAPVGKPPRFKRQDSSVKASPMVYADDLPAPTEQPAQVHWFLEKVREERVAQLEGRDTQTVRVKWLKPGAYTLVAKVLVHAGEYGQLQETTRPMVYYVKFIQQVEQSLLAGGEGASSKEPPEPSGDPLLDAYDFLRWETEHPQEAQAHLAQHPEDVADPVGMGMLTPLMGGTSATGFFAQCDQFLTAYAAAKGTLSARDALKAYLVKYPGGPSSPGSISAEFKLLANAAVEALGQDGRLGYFRGPLRKADDKAASVEFQEVFPTYGEALHTGEGTNPAGQSTSVLVFFNIATACYSNALGIAHGEGFQCAELAMRHGKNLGASVDGNGSTWSKPGKAGVEVFEAGRTDEPPQNLDWVSHDHGGFGHVGVITEVKQTDADSISAVVHQQNVTQRPSQKEAAKALAASPTQFTRSKGIWSGGAFGYGGSDFKAWSRPAHVAKAQRAQERALPLDIFALAYATKLGAMMKVGSSSVPDACLETFLELFGMGSRTIRMTWYAYHVGSSGDTRMIGDLARTFTQARAADVLYILGRFKEAGIEDVPVSTLRFSSLGDKRKKDKASAKAREDAVKAQEKAAKNKKAKDTGKSKDQAGSKGSDVLSPAAQAEQLRREQEERDKAGARKQGDALVGPIEVYRLYATRSGSSYPTSAHFVLAPVVKATGVASEGSITPGTTLTYRLKQQLEPKVNGKGLLTEAEPAPKSAHFSPADVRWLVTGNPGIKKTTQHGEDAWTLRWPKTGRFEVSALFNAQVGTAGESADSPSHLVSYEVRFEQEVVAPDSLKSTLEAPVLVRKLKNPVTRGAKEKLELKLAYPKKHQTVKPAPGAPFYQVSWSVLSGAPVPKEGIHAELKSLLEAKKTEWKQLFYQQWRTNPAWEVVWDLPAGQYNVQAEATYSSETSEATPLTPLTVAIQIEDPTQKKKG